MGNIYHIKCFTCTHCGDQLEGKPFYHIDNKPYCEEGYLVSLILNIWIINLITEICHQSMLINHKKIYYISKLLLLYFPYSLCSEINCVTNVYDTNH